MSELQEQLVKSLPIFELAKKTPLFVLNDRLYYCESKENGNRFSYKGIKSGVKEGPSVFAMEKVGISKITEIYDKYEKDFIRREVEKRNKPKEDKDYDEDNYDSEDNKRYGNNDVKRLKRFAVTRIFPHLAGDSSQLNEILGTKEDKKPEISKENMKEVQDYIEKRRKEIEGQFDKKLMRTNRLEEILFNTKLKKSTISESLFSKAAEGYNFSLVNGRVYFLADTNSDENLILEGKKYKLIEGLSKGELADRLETEVKKQIQLRAIEKLHDNADFIGSFDSGFSDDIINKTSYKEKDYGFESTREGLLVYLVVPPHALEEVLEDEEEYDDYGRRRKSTKPKIYRFPSFKIYIKLLPENGITLAEGCPFGIGNPNTPFMSEGEDLCMGDYSSNFLQNMEKGKAFAKLLFDARNVILHGYNEYCTPRQTVADIGRSTITEGQAKRLGIPITNRTNRRIK